MNSPEFARMVFGLFVLIVVSIFISAVNWYRFVGRNHEWVKMVATLLTGPGWKLDRDYSKSTEHIWCGGIVHEPTNVSTHSLIAESPRETEYHVAKLIRAKHKELLAALESAGRQRIVDAFLNDKPIQSTPSQLTAPVDTPINWSVDGKRSYARSHTFLAK